MPKNAWDHRKRGWMESCLLNVTESIPNIALFPFEADLLKAAEISTASESHLWNGAEMFITSVKFYVFSFELGRCL